MSDVLYPVGYGSTLVTMRRLRELHEPRMHPHFAAPLFAWIESMGGEVGIGSGWRAPGTQPDAAGFAPEGKTFHQDQVFNSKLVRYAAVDLVRKNPTGGAHVGMRWSDSDTAPAYGLHTFINGEPWHMQNTNIRGWQSWVNAGRPDPILVNYPGITPPKPPPHTGAPVTTTSTDWLVPAQRIMDSRWWDEAGRFGDDLPNDTGVRHIPCTAAAGKKAVTVTVTAVAPRGPGFVTLFTSGETPPNVSALNYGPAIPAIANTTTVPVAADGSFKVYLSSNAHCVIDLVGVHA